uniref:Kinesin family member 24 n=1 Tax=Macrostomum lignano TaxID=282301 RepID=A0A1I8FQJ3_9PLAT
LKTALAPELITNKGLASDGEKKTGIRPRLPQPPPLALPAAVQAATKEETRQASAQARMHRLGTLSQKYTGHSPRYRLTYQRGGAARSQDVPLLGHSAALHLSGWPIPTKPLAGEGGSGRVGPEAPGPRRRGPHASCTAAEQAAKAWTMRK